MFKKKPIIYLIIIICILTTLLSGCAKVKDKDATVKVDALDLDLTNVKCKDSIFAVNKVYNSIESMVADSKYIVEGTVENIEYFVDKKTKTPRTKVDLLVSKSYSGDIEEDTTISIIEQHGYIPVKLYTEDYVKKYGKYHPFFPEEDIKNGVVLKITLSSGKFSKVGDHCIYFLIDIKTPYVETSAHGDIRMDALSPKGAYKPIGILMGKFTLETLHNTDYYLRNNHIYTSSNDPKTNGFDTRSMPITPKDEFIAELEECLKKK